MGEGKRRGGVVYCAQGDRVTISYYLLYYSLIQCISLPNTMSTQKAMYKFKIRPKV